MMSFCFIFVDLSRKCADCPVSAVFFWYQGWQRNYEAINATLPNVRAINAVGAVGFSQGGAVAALLDGISCHEVMRGGM